MSKCKQYCSVPQCNNYRAANISMHMFPSDVLLKKQWQIALKIGKKITTGMMVCSEHFQETDFFPTKLFSTDMDMSLKTKKRLKKGVIPSRKLPVTTHHVISQKNQADRKKRREDREMKKITKQESEDITSSIEVIGPHASNSRELVDVISKGRETEDESNAKTAMSDKSIQVNTFINPKYKIIEHILSSEKTSKVFLGITVNMFNAIKRSAMCMSENVDENMLSNLDLKLCVVFMKLKMNLTFVSLAAMCAISNRCCSNYFYKTVQFLAFVLKPLIYWPSKGQNMSCMPKCFKNYKSVKVIIDATEIAIEKNSCLKCKIRTYSHYKKGHTLKYLICVTPSGVISYVSSGYGGRVSDKAIFNKEEIINLTEPFVDSIMVDKGFLIENECAASCVTLMRPPFLRQKKQFSKEEALTTASIARARVHVERVIQRIKIFKIFQCRLNWSLIPYLDDCMIIVCGLVNLSSPILSDCKF